MPRKQFRQKKLTFKKYVNQTTRKRIWRILSIAKRKLFNEVGGDRGSMSAYPPDQRQLRIPNVPKSDGRTPVTRQFVQLLETALGKELRRPRKRNDPSRRVSRGTSFAELTADDKSDDQGERSSLTLVEAIRTDLSILLFPIPSLFRRGAIPRSFCHPCS